ncbi:MAG: DMT family transporter [Rubrivivax sp.]|jgi:drug/metabolite transporter (DMT)-like permease|nr:DMT family transporter [Rubrivivax sp.]
MTHQRALLMMVAATVLWSTAGVVTRYLESARSFEVTFWRSAFNALALIVLLSWLRGPLPLWRTLRTGGRALWVSGLCWCVMYTAFMLALTLTTVANVLVTMALAPLFTAIGARVALGHRLAPRTWLAIVVAGAGIVWMYGHELSGGDARHLGGVLVALCVPLAAATNWTLLQAQAARAARPATAVADGAGTPADPPADMLTAVLLGALLSALITLPLALPMRASLHDVSLLGLLGVFQLAIPCLMAVAASRVLKAPEAALLSLLEVIFGVSWAWLSGTESPSQAVILGGLLVLVALALNEWLSMRQRAAEASAATADPPARA